MAHTYSSLLVHLVFSTKERRPWLDEPLRPKLFAYLGGIAAECGAKAVIVNGVADHVHLLVFVPANLALAELVRVLKANSSLWIHREFADTHREFAWQSGYAAFSVSRSNQSAVERYISNQAAHHPRQDFAEEYLALLQKHGIAYDERFVLD